MFPQSLRTSRMSTVMYTQTVYGTKPSEHDECPGPFTVCYISGSIAVILGPDQTKDTW